MIELPSSGQVEITQVSALSTDLSDLQGGVDALSTDLYGELNGLQGNIGTLGGQLTDLQGSVSALSDQLTDVQGSISNLDDRVTALENRVSALEGGNPPAPVDPGLVLYTIPEYAEPLPPNKLTDHSIYGNHGTFKGAGEPDWVQLPSGIWVMDFDGSDDFVTIGASTSLAFNDGTILLWFYRRTDISGADNIVHLTGTSGSMNLYGGSSSTPMIFRIADGGNNDVMNDLGTQEALNVWHHVAIRFGAAGMTMIIDGVLQADSNAYAGGFNDGTPTFYISNQPGVGARRLDGQIALLKIYNYALSPAQITELYNQEKLLFGP